MADPRAVGPVPGGHHHPDDRDRRSARLLGERLAESERGAPPGRRPPRGRPARRTPGCTAQLVERRPARPASSTSGSGWPARSTTPSPTGLTGIVTQLEAAQQAADRPDERDPPHRQCSAPRAREPLRGPPVARGRPAGGPRVGEPARGAGVGRRPLVGDQRRPRRGHDHRRAGRRSTPRSSRRCCGRRRRPSRTSRSTPRRRGSGVTLSFMGDVVALDVRDDGVGFEVSEGRAAHGCRASG